MRVTKDGKSKLAATGQNVAPGLAGGAISALFVSHSPLALIPALGAAAVRAAIDAWAERRVEQATLSAHESVAHRIQRGDSPRIDLFDADSGRPVAEELFEGAVRAARDDFEDRKAAHYGVFVVNYVFSPEVTGADARTMLRLAERLNWRQWVILEWVRRNGKTIRHGLRLQLPLDGTSKISLRLTC